MGKKAISNESINDQTDLTLCKDGYWLYDENMGMNLAMRAPTEKDALIEALEYYQNRLLQVESELKEKSQIIENTMNALGVVSKEDIEDMQDFCDRYM